MSHFHELGVEEAAQTWSFFLAWNDLHDLLIGILEFNVHLLHTTEFTLSHNENIFVFNALLK